MSHATFTFGRFNPPTEAGHGKLIDAVKSHAESTGGQHYIFPSHSQDPKKNPLTHHEKVGAMKKMFPGTHIVSNEGIRNAIGALKHIQSQGHTHATMIVGDDRVHEFHSLLHKYNGKEYNFKKIEVKSAGHRDPDAEGSEGMSASKLRGLVKSGKRDEFISHYSDKKLGAQLHDRIKKAMNESRKAMFILGGPGSGKDYVITNILSRFSLTEVQMDQILNGNASQLIEESGNLLINGNADADKIKLVKSILEGFDFAHTVVSVSNKVSRERNATRDRPLNENVRIRKWLDAENIQLENSFIFKNSLNLREASQKELVDFQGQIEEYLKFLLDNGYRMDEVLEWGTPETTAAFKAATPGEVSNVDTKPKLTVKGLRKRGVKNMPPNAYDNRVGGVQYTNYAGGGAYTGGALGGLVAHHVPEGKPLNELSDKRLAKYVKKATKSADRLAYYSDSRNDPDWIKSNKRDRMINVAKKKLGEKK